MALQILSVFLIALSSGLLVVESRSYNTGLIFYDLTTKQAFLPPTVSVSRGRGLANIKFSDKGSIWSTFGKPCDCRGPLCGCCVGIKVKQYDFDQKMCANVSYVKPKEEINLEVYLNETQSAKYGVSARNPSPFCIPVMMGIPMSMCVQMSNVGLQGNNLNMCMDFIVRMASTQLFEMHFQCMKMGAQGVQWVGPGGSPVIPESKIKEGSNNDSVEYYDEEEGEEKNEIDTGNNEEEQAEEEEENNEIVTADKEGEEEIDKGDEEGQQDVEENENKAEEVMDENDLKNRDQDLAMEMQPSEGEQTKENEVDLSEEAETEIVEKELSKDTIKVSEHPHEILENSTDSLDVFGFNMLTNIKETPEYPNEILENSTDSSELSGAVDMLTNVEETLGNDMTNESDSNEFLIAPLEVITEKQLNENAILANLKPTMATTTPSMLVVENNDIDNVDNTATIATIMSTITSTIASVTATAATVATLEAQGISATPKTPVATTTTVAATSTIAVDKNDSDNSQDNDNDSDYEDEDEESDENEEDESEKEEEEEEESDEKENPHKGNESESQKEQLENLNNVNTTAAGNGANLNANNKDKENEIENAEEGQEAGEEDEDEVDEDDADENEDEDETEENSDEITTESLGIDKPRHQNTSFIENITTAEPAISLTTLSTTNASAETTEKITKPDEHLININSNHLQLATETKVNTSANSDYTNIDISDSNNVKPTSNINISSIATQDSTPPNAGGNNDDIVKMSQITGTVTPLTSARKLLALQRQSHPRQQQKQRQQQRQRQRQKKQQQQQTKWQYPLHQQVQHQHHNHNRIQYQVHTPRQQRNNRLYYGA